MKIEITVGNIPGQTPITDFFNIHIKNFSMDVQDFIEDYIETDEEREMTLMQFLGEFQTTWDRQSFITDLMEMLYSENSEMVVL